MKNQGKKFLSDLKLYSDYLRWDNEKNRYEKTYFEEVSQEDITESEIFKQIQNKQVDHFNVIGGDMYKVELCIYLNMDE